MMYGWFRQLPPTVTSIISEFDETQMVCREFYADHFGIKKSEDFIEKCQRNHEIIFRAILATKTGLLQYFCDFSTLRISFWKLSVNSNSAIKTVLENVFESDFAWNCIPPKQTNFLKHACKHRKVAFSGCLNACGKKWSCKRQRICIFQRERDQFYSIQYFEVCKRPETLLSARVHAHFFSHACKLSESLYFERFFATFLQARFQR